MQRGYLVDTIRASEAVALAALPPGALMQRAAAGLATCILRELRRANGGGVCPCGCGRACHLAQSDAREGAGAGRVF